MLSGLFRFRLWTVEKTLAAGRGTDPYTQMKSNLSRKRRSSDHWINMSKILLILAALLVFSGAGIYEQSGTSANVKAFVGARVIDGAGTPAIENAVLVVRDGRVEAVGPASALRSPAGA